MYFQILQKEVIFIDLSHCTSLCTSAKGQKEAEIWFSLGLNRFGYPGFFGSFRLVAIQLTSVPFFSTPKTGLHSFFYPVNSE